MSLQYVVYDYWEYGYAEGDAILEFGSASITADAAVSAFATRTKFFSGSVAGFATVTANGSRVLVSSASITGNAQVSTSANRVRLGSGSIDGLATVSALGGVVYSGFGAITGEASVSAYPNAIWAGNAYIDVVTICSATGQIIGDEWSDLIPGINTWSQVSEAINTWTPAVIGSNVWVNDRFFDPYVEIDYWEDGYADDRYDYWVKESSTQDNWTRQ